jgi:inorganic pyrophosphatase
MINLDRLSSGEDPPNLINVVVEVPSGSNVKYELDPATGAIFVDRFLYTATHYPFNYGFIPQTRADDGDPVDVGVVTQHSVFPMSVIRARPIGVLLAKDEKGLDPKVIAVPSTKIDPYYERVKDVHDLPEFTRNQIEDFFRRYKELEPKKFVKIFGWKGRKFADDLIAKSIDHVSEREKGIDHKFVKKPNGERKCQRK